MRPFFKKNKKGWDNEINPEDILMDSQNIPGFNNQQFEGRFERPISKQTIAIVGIFFGIIGIAFISKLGLVQIVKGETYYKQGENNSLTRDLIFADRGVIYDRNGVELVWNDVEEGETFPHRSYTDEPGLGHILGYVGYPTRDKAGFYWQTTFVGKDGIEKYYDTTLNGTNGEKIIETNVFGEVQSENIIEPPHKGNSLNLSIDSRVQNKFYEYIRETAMYTPFEGGAGVIMDIHTGELLALSSYPEYDSEILSDGEEADIINSYRTSSKKPFLNRAVSGLYTPGSIIKPVLAIGVLNENIIDPNKKILSTGSISIPNPYFPELESVFVDWKAHGWVDLRRAIAVSSNVYFYEVGGGYEGQKGLGIANIEKYMRMFGLGNITELDLNGEIEGVIPNPKWKESVFDGDPWRIGDTYNTAIGQYGFQVTPLQVARGIAIIANKGRLITPRMTLKEDVDVLTEEEIENLDIDKKYFDIIHEGMRQTVTLGTAGVLNNSYVKIAAKTGTAQVGLSKKYVNSWVVGFFPYENPRFSFVVLMDRGPSGSSSTATYVMRQLVDWMGENTPEYIK